MQKTEPASVKNGVFSAMSESAEGFVASAHGDLSVRQLEKYLRDWIRDGEARRFSPRSIELRRFLHEKLIWLLQRDGCTHFGRGEVRLFFSYLNNGHTDPEGRWGNPRMTRPLSSGSIHDYYRLLRAFCNWLVAEEFVSVSPMARMKPPEHRANQVRPFSPEQVTALLHAASRSTNPNRDEAIILLLLDTGLRASELCGLTLNDVDLSDGSCVVRGKGDKTRRVPIGRTASKALAKYLRTEHRREWNALFASDRGHRAGEALTRSGLLQLLERLGKAARIRGVRCSPHTLRHTFAVQFLNAGGNQRTLQEILGHTDGSMTVKYLNISATDVDNQHRQFSPADRLKRGKS